MTLRAACAATAAAGLLFSGAAASAAPAKLCRQILDQAGDGTLVPGYVPHRDSLDILSGDVATGRKNLVAALRLASTAPDPELVGGVTYTLRFFVADVQHELVYRIFGTGEVEAVLVIDGRTLSEFRVSGVTDHSTKTITWTVPRTQVPSLARRGVKLVKLRGGAAIGNNVKTPGGGARGSIEADRAETGLPYHDGTPTCLRGV